MLKRRIIRAAVAAFAAVAALSAGLYLQAAKVIASDHNEAPLVKADASMDLTDLYLFDGAAGKTVAVINFAGFNDSLAQPVQAGVYNTNALYTLNIDNDADNAPDFTVLTRFGQNGAGGFGVQVENLPGAGGTIAGPVETTLTGNNGAKVFAGLRDDPFFFDVQGYLETLDTGTLSIINTRDSLAGLNVNSIVLEFDTAAALEGGTTLSCWITSGRK